MSIKKLNSEEISFLCSQFAIIIRTGVALHDGVEVIMEDMDTEEGKSILMKISQTLNDEKPLYIALENTKVFPEYVIKMVKIGELTGRLDEVLDNLAGYYETETSIKRSLHDAIIQPMMILSLMLVVVVAFVVKILPAFRQIFKQFDPILGKSVSNSIKVSSTIGYVSIISLLVVFVAVIILYVLSGSLKNSKQVNSLFSMIPGISSLLDKYAITRFANAMYLMIRSGVDSSTSMEYAIELNNNKKLGVKLNECLEKLNNYEAFSDVIAQSGIFAGIYKQMLKLAYKTGAYEQAWEKINKKYSMELEDNIAKIIAIIEPILVATITILIGVILISVMLPLMSIMGNI